MIPTLFFLLTGVRGEFGDAPDLAVTRQYELQTPLGRNTGRVTQRNNFAQKGLRSR